MARTANDIPMGRQMPPKGIYRCTCIGTRRDLSKTKKTPYLELEWMAAEGGGTSFTDSLFLTAKAMNRLVLVARHVCAMPGEFPLDDDDKKAVEQLAVFIENNIVNREAMIEVEETQEEILVQSGPEIGQKKLITKRRVSFGGYNEITPF